MKTVLLIAYRYPPTPVIGAVRPAKFVKYLSEYGWRPIVVTINVAGIKASKLPVSIGDNVIRTCHIPYAEALRKMIFLVRRLSIKASSPLSGRRGGMSRLKRRGGGWLKLVRELFFFPDEAFGWYPYAVKAGLSIIKHTPVDLIMSTSNPVTTHLVARALKKNTGLPWIADLRDLWSQDKFEWYVEKTKTRQFLEERLEQATLVHADALITVSEPLAEVLKTSYPSKCDKIHTITNGYDPEDFNGLKKSPPAEFVITYTGCVYGGGRDPSPLFQAASELLKEGIIRSANFRIRFYGSGPAPGRIAADYGITELVDVYEKIPRREALQKQINSTILLVIQWNPKARAGAYTGKIFEYLGARRPILALAPEGSVISTLLQKTGAGEATTDSSEIKTIIRRWYREFLSTGAVKYTGRAEEVRHFCFKEKTRQLALVMSSLIVD